MGSNLLFHGTRIIYRKRFNLLDLAVSFVSLEVLTAEYGNWSKTKGLIDQICDCREASVKVKWCKLANYYQREFFIEKFNFPPYMLVLLTTVMPAIIKRLNKAVFLS